MYSFWYYYFSCWIIPLLIGIILGSLLEKDQSRRRKGSCRKRNYACSCGTKVDLLLFGVTEDDSSYLEDMGWRKVNKEWKCPLCTGHTEFLSKYIDI